MPDFLLRDVPEHVMRELKTRSARSGRSIQAEIRTILEDALPIERGEWFRQAAALRARVKPDPLSQDEIVEETRRARDARTERILAAAAGRSRADDEEPDE